MNILDHWPNSSLTPRDIQVTALRWIEENQDAKFFFVQAPVGSGKSLIGTTAGRFFAANNPTPSKQASFILTPQRILQRQYEQSFESNILASLYGKSNYPCHNRNTTCDIGSILKPQCQACPYKKAKELAKQRENCVLNYTIALLAFKYTDIFKPRPFMILDECHTIEEHLTEIDAATISTFRTKQIGIDWVHHTTLPDAYEWTNNVYLPKADEVIFKKEQDLAHIINDDFSEPTPVEIKELQQLLKLQEHVDSIREVTIRPLESLMQTFVLVHDKESKKFKRINGGYNFHRILEPRAEKFLFMSSTILNYRGFCRDLEIDPDQAVYLDLESEFPSENRPVFFMPQTRMNADWNKPENGRGKKKMISKVEEILKMHEDHKGIIHTGNFAIARWLVEELQYQGSHQIFHHNPESKDDRNSVIDAFQQYPKPSILISPSITEGLDLKDDLARFAIIAKVPFGYLGDQWIKRRMELSKEWYQRRALIDIIQGAGRVVRSDTDWGNTYILDESFRHLFQQAQDTVPQWWKDAYRVA